MRDPSKWLNEVRRATEELSGRWSTRAEFQEILRALLGRIDSPIAQLELRFDSPEPFQRFAVAAVSDDGGAAGESTGVWSVSLADNRPTTCRVTWWETPEHQVSQTKLQHSIDQVIIAFWKPDLRTETAGLPDLKRVPQVGQLADATLAARAVGEPAAALFCDLDNFKNVNQTRGHPEGDRVIKRFGALLEACAADTALVLHNGGDEFAIVIPRGGEFRALQLANAISSAGAEWARSEDGIDVTVSAGIAVIAPGQIEDFPRLLDRAEQVLNTELKAKDRAAHELRGSARINESEAALIEPAWSINERCALAKCVVKAGALSDEPFANVWLNTLSAIVRAKIGSNGTDEQVAAVVAQFLDWAKPVAQHGLTPANFGYGNIRITSPRFSQLDCAFAIVHALLRAGPSDMQKPALKIRCDAAGASCAVMREGTEAPIWAPAPNGTFTEEIVVGTAPTLASQAASGFEIPAGSAMAVLIKIGHAQPVLPEVLFSAEMIVDDRPTIGGGLPDFWELTIARLISHVVDHPRVTAVFVLGEHDNGRKTVDTLKGIDQWETRRDELAARLPVTASDITHVAQRLSGKIYFPADEQSLVTELAPLLTDSSPLPLDRSHVFDRGRPLKLKMDVLPAALQVADGCRVATLADAYPTILEILRNSDAQVIRDQARQHLRELLDFKVVLTKPLRDRVPSFFVGQESELKAYFDREFVKPTGVFREALERHCQLETVLAHVRDILGKPQLAVATRRAVLTVPHECEEGGECRPLGLTSIRIIPRFDGSAAILNYSFTWRTVEALIGFPYSAYGSICFAESITERLGRELGAVVELSTGQLSYIAHSLHFFVDEYGQKIARRIVHDASD